MVSSIRFNRFCDRLCFLCFEYFVNIGPGSFIDLQLCVLCALFDSSGVDLAEFSLVSSSVCSLFRFVPLF